MSRFNFITQPIDSDLNKPDCVVLIAIDLHNSDAKVSGASRFFCRVIALLLAGWVCLLSCASAHAGFHAALHGHHCEHADGETHSHSPEADSDAEDAVEGCALCLFAHPGLDATPIPVLQLVPCGSWVVWRLQWPVETPCDLRITGLPEERGPPA